MSSPLVGCRRTVLIAHSHELVIGPGLLAVRPLPFTLDSLLLTTHSPTTTTNPATLQGKAIICDFLPLDYILVLLSTPLALPCLWLRFLDWPGPCPALDRASLNRLRKDHRIFTPIDCGGFLIGTYCLPSPCDPAHTLFPSPPLPFPSSHPLIP